MAAPLALVLVVAVTVRAALFRSSLAEFISERVEVVSPLSSWKRGEAAGSSRRSGPACALLASEWKAGALAASSILRELTR